jgi:hypothetical protein
MTTATVSRWARRFLVVSAVFLVASQVASLAGAGHRVEVVLALQGFVLTTVFGKAYSLVPSYFDRTLVWPPALAVHLPLTVVGVSGLALWAASVGPAWVGPVGALAWTLGVGTFVTVMLVTIRGNLTGSETGTGDSEHDRKRTDRVANAFVPVALLYLVGGSYELLAGRTSLPTLLDGTYPRVAHLLAAGFALLLLFAVGYRLLPRFLSVPTPGRLAVVVLPAGALGPALIAWGLPAGPAMHAGAALEATAVVGFALSYSWLVAGSDRKRVGFYGPLLGVLLGVVGVALGVSFAIDVPRVALTIAHFRLNVPGLLGLSIVGVVFQFYPPAIGQWPFAGDRLAVATLGVLATGIGVAALGAATAEVVATGGHAIATVGGLGYLYLLVAAIRGGTTRR